VPNTQPAQKHKTQNSTHKNKTPNKKIKQNGRKSSIKSTKAKAVIPEETLDKLI
jgi:hypothetical protein